jgi:hypothetical protein
VRIEVISLAKKCLVGRIFGGLIKDTYFEHGVYSTNNEKRREEILAI